MSYEHEGDIPTNNSIYEGLDLLRDDFIKFKGSVIEIVKTCDKYFINFVALMIGVQIRCN